MIELNFSLSIAVANVKFLVGAYKLSNLLFYGLLCEDLHHARKPEDHRYDFQKMAMGALDLPCPSLVSYAYLRISQHLFMLSCRGIFLLKLYWQPTRS